MTDESSKKEIYLTFDDDEWETIDQPKSAKKSKKAKKPKKVKKSKTVVAKSVAFEPTAPEKKVADLPIAQKSKVGAGEMSAFQRFIISIMVLLLVGISGILALVLSGRFQLPF